MWRLAVSFKDRSGAFELPALRGEVPSTLLDPADMGVSVL
jgi:hypothetical protein